MKIQRVQPPKVEELAIKGFVIEPEPGTFKLRIFIVRTDGEEKVKTADQVYASHELADLALQYEMEAQVVRLNQKGYRVAR